MDLPIITPDYFQILVLRELRKVGLDAGQPRVHRRTELPDPERGFLLELVIPLGGVGAVRRALVVCRRQDSVVTREIVESVSARRRDAAADAAMIFSTADFSTDAVASARQSAVALLRIADGRTVFDAAGWGSGDVAAHYPAWLPAHMAQLVDCDAAGVPRARVLEPGQPDMLLDVIRSARE